MFSVFFNQQYFKAFSFSSKRISVLLLGFVVKILASSFLPEFSNTKHNKSINPKNGKKAL